MYRNLRKEVEVFRSEIIRFTRQLVRTPSVSLQETEIAALVEGKLRELNYDLVFKDEIGNVVGAIFGGDPHFTIVLNSHLDTVHPNPVDEWSSPPFSGDILDGRIFGVGASDCKSGLAAQVFAAHALACIVSSLRGNIVVAATVAEEKGCSLGARHLFRHTLPQLGVTPRFVILGEPTGLGVGYGHDGWARFDIDIMGVDEKQVRGAAQHIFDRVTLFCDTPGRSVPRTVLAAEPPVFMVCPECFAQRIAIVRRLFAGENAAGIIDRLTDDVVNGFEMGHGIVVEIRLHEELLRPDAGGSVHVKVMSKPWLTNLRHPLVERARKALVAAGIDWIPEMWVLNRLGMGTAGSFITSEIGIPAIGFGPGEEAQAHNRNESVSISSLVEAAYGTAAITYGLIGGQLEQVH